MGLSKSKTKTKTTSNETGTMTPTNPQFVTDAIQGHTQRINDFAKVDPSTLVAGPTGLQQQSWGQAGSLGGWQGGNQAAQDRAAGVSGAPNLAGRVGLGGPASYSAPNLGGPMNVSAVGYSAPQLGDADMAELAKAAGVTLAEAQSYTAPEIAALREAIATQGAQYMDDYRNPYTNDVVNTSLAGFDENAGRVRAQQAAQGAANGAFGGSRFALREAQTEGELGRERASLEAGLRSNAFNTAAGLGMSDADRFGQVSMGNAQMGNTRNQAQAGLTADARRHGADARNQFALTQGDMDLRNNQFNAGLETQNNQFNAGSRNQFTLGQANLDAQAGMFTAGAQNQANMFNAGNENQFALSQAGFDAQAGQFNAGQQNQFALTQGQMDAQNNQFNAGQMDAGAQRDLQAAGLMGQLSSDQANQQRGDLGLLADMGNQQWQVEQARAQAPLQQMQALSGMHAANPYALFSGRNTTGSATGTSTTTQPGGIGMGLLGAASNMFSFAPIALSDRRLKADIVKIDQLSDGLNVYRWRYVDGFNLPEGEHIGVMADEVRELRPQAFIPNLMGEYHGVNYAALGEM